MFIKIVTSFIISQNKFAAIGYSQGKREKYTDKKNSLFSLK